MGWVTMSSSDAVNLVYQLSHILEKSSKRKINKILNLQLKQMKTPLKNNNKKKKTKKPLLVALPLQNSQDIGKETVTNSNFWHFQVS